MGSELFWVSTTVYFPHPATQKLLNVSLFLFAFPPFLVLSTHREREKAFAVRPYLPNTWNPRLAALEEEEISDTSVDICFRAFEFEMLNFPFPLLHFLSCGRKALFQPPQHCVYHYDGPLNFTDFCLVIHFVLVSFGQYRSAPGGDTG